MGDVVVVVPGIMGSVLTRGGVEVWNLSRGAAWEALRSRLRSLTDLALPDGIGDKHPGDGVEPAGLMRTVHVIPGVWSPVVGYDGMIDYLRRGFTLTIWDRDVPDRPANLVPFAYDWRLSNRYNGERLAREIGPILRLWRQTTNPDAKLVLICHSMGGLVARHFLECCRGAADCRMLITLGTPYRGSLAALLNLVNGLAGGRLAAGLTALARSMPSLYQLAPAYACLSVDGTLRYRYPGEVALPLSTPQTRMLADGALFHEQIDLSVRRRGSTPYAVVPVHGFRQPTPTTASITADGRLVAYTSIDGWDEGGDGRVPRLSASPPEHADADSGAAAATVERGCPEQHGALMDNPVIRDHVWAALTSRRRPHRGPADADLLGVDAPDLLGPGQPCTLTVTAPATADRLVVTATLTSVDGPPDQGGRGRTLRNLGGGRYTITFADLTPGLYQIAVRAATGAHPLTRHLLVWDDEHD